MFYFKKNLGQNFLRDERKVEQIVQITNISGKEVLEIGPGDGSITKALSGASKLYLVEKDTRLIPSLEERFPEAEIFNEDFLEWDVAKHLKEAIVVSNLPFNISAPVIEKLIGHRSIFKKAYLVLQKEFAERAVAKPGTNRGPLSVLVELFSDAKIEMYIPKGCFYPKPDVDAALVSFSFNSREDDGIMEIGKILFSERRKQLLNNLSKIVEREEAKGILSKLGIAFDRRAESLSLKEIESIFHSVRGVR